MARIVTVDFRDDTLFAVERDDGVFVALKPICDRLGLAWGSQYNRLMRDTILAEGIFIMKMPLPGGAQEMTCLRLELVNGWLFGIDESRVKPELHEAVLTYKRECYAVLAARFLPGRAPVVEPSGVFGPTPYGGKSFYQWTPDEVTAQCRLAELILRTRDPEWAYAFMTHIGMPVGMAVLFGGRPVPGQMLLPLRPPQDAEPGGPG